MLRKTLFETKMLQADLDSKLVIASRIMLVTFTVLVGLSLIVFDGEPFVCDNGTTIFAHLFALLTLLSAVFLLTRHDMFIPWTSATHVPTTVIRDAPFVHNKGGKTVQVSAMMSTSIGDTRIVYWDDRGIAGVAQVKNRNAVLDVTPGSDVVYYRTLQGDLKLGPVKSLVIRSA